MLVVGAGGFAKELIDVVVEQYPSSSLVCFDSFAKTNDLFLNRFDIINKTESAKKYFQTTEASFCLGLGGPLNRLRLFNEFSAIGGQPISIISSHTKLGSINVAIGVGSTILHHTTIANGSRLGIGCLVYHDVRITHDCSIGDFVEIAPGATLLGGVTVGAYTQIGANCTILPKLTIGKHCILGAGAVITRNIPDNSIVTGIPGKVVRTISSSI